MPLLVSAGSEPDTPEGERCRDIHHYELDLDVLLENGAGFQPAISQIGAKGLHVENLPHENGDSATPRIVLSSDESWWIDLLYRLDLDDLGRTRVSIEPSLGTFEGAVRRSLDGESAAATSGLSKGARSSQPGSESSSKEKEPVRASEVAAVAERLESQYGHLPAPPPLWRAWFQAVHGDRLRKIQDHFALETE